MRPLVMPVNSQGQARERLKEDDDEAALAVLASSGFKPTSATDGNAVATQLEAVRKMDPQLDGTGQLVCIIDTGLAFVNSPLYGNCQGVNAPKGKCKVVAGYDFVGDAYTGLQTGPAAVRGGLPVSCCCCCRLCS
jgi:hypothetical protein